jgi:hypothetical protein
MKKLYFGSFNYKGELHRYYRFAIGSGQAKQFMLRALADKIGVSFLSLRNYFSGKEDNFSVRHYRGKAIDGKLK